MKGGKEFQTLLANSALDFPHDIAAGPHAYGVPAIDVAIPHGEAVGMFGDRPDVPGAGLFEESNPGVRTEVLGSEGGSKILVTEAIQRAVGSDLVLVLRPTRQVHPVRVPLTGKGGNRVETPMEINAELGVAVPVRTRMVLQGVPARLVRLLAWKRRKPGGEERWYQGGRGPCGKPLQGVTTGDGHSLSLHR